MKKKLKEYCEKHNLVTEEALAKHIIELKKNTVVPKITFELVNLLYNKKLNIPSNTLKEGNTDYKTTTTTPIPLFQYPLDFNKLNEAVADKETNVDDWYSKNREYTDVKKDAQKNIEMSLNFALNNIKEDLESARFKLTGIKFNKGKAPLDVMQTIQFPNALYLLSLASKYGHEKYNANGEDEDFLNFTRVAGGSQTFFDAAARHNTDRNNLDEESGLHHIIHSVWNNLAALELWVKENNVNVKKYICTE